MTEKEVLFGLKVLVDLLTFAGSVTLAVDAFLRRGQLAELKKDRELRRMKPGLRLRDREMKQAQESVRRAIWGIGMVAAGFLLQLVVRFVEGVS